MLGWSFLRIDVFARGNDDGNIVDFFLTACYDFMVKFTIVCLQEYISECGVSP